MTDEMLSKAMALKSEIRTKETEYDRLVKIREDVIRNYTGRVTIHCQSHINYTLDKKLSKELLLKQIDEDIYQIENLIKKCKLEFEKL